MKLYLVTAQDETIRWGVSMDVNGVFSTRDLADVWVSEHPEIGYPDITEMMVDHPENESDSYPGVWYEERGEKK